MKVGVDCRLSGITHTGIGRYVENLITRLPALGPDIEWVYFFRQKSQLEIKAANVTSIIAPVGHYTLAEQTQLVSIFNEAKLDVLHVPHFNAPVLYSGKMILTIHDLLWHDQRGSEVTTLKAWQYWGKYLGYQFVTSQAISHAKHIIVPTASTKKTLLKHYPKADGKITITHEGIDNRLLKFKKQTKRNPKTLLYVGSLYPHKNLVAVIKALKSLPAWKLEIIGARDVFHQKTLHQVKEAGVEKQVKFLGKVSDEKLAQSLQAATALVQPSLSEGFGLTGIEAMSLETPVISSNIPVLKEVYQQAAVYFDPTSSQSLIDVLNNLPKNLPNKSQLNAVSQLYSWDKMASQTLAVYNQVYES